VTRVAVVPAAPVLLARHAGLVDPVPELRAACAAAVDWVVVGARGPVTALCAGPSPADRARGVVTSHGGQLAAELLGEALGELVAGPVTGPVASLAGRDLLVLADGSARRGEKAPGHLDPRATAYDDEVGAALASGDLSRLRDLDVALGEELWAEGAPVLRALAGAVEPSGASEVLFSGDPFGVQYWVLTWTAGS